MARLSQRGINNVVIFAMLVMIGLFNIDALLPAAKTPSARPLIMPGDYVQKIEQDNNRLERVGQQWRQVSAHSSLPVTPQQQLSAWQSATLSPVVQSSSATNVAPYIAVVWLAGQSSGKVFAFYPQRAKVLVKHNEQWFTLNPPALYTLLPWNPELAKAE